MCHIILNKSNITLSPLGALRVVIVSTATYKPCCATHVLRLAFIALVNVVRVLLPLKPTQGKQPRVQDLGDD